MGKSDEKGSALLDGEYPQNAYVCALARHRQRLFGSMLMHLFMLLAEACICIAIAQPWILQHAPQRNLDYMELPVEHNTCDCTATHAITRANS